MAVPNLPVNVDTTYADNGGDASVKLHQQHHDTIHGIVNALDTAIGTANTGSALVWNGSIYTPGADLAYTNVRTVSYTLVLSDANLTVEMNVATANTATIPPNSSVAFPIGTVLNVFQLGAGVTTIVAGAGVTLLKSSVTANLYAQYSTVSLRQRAANSWVLSGDLA